MHVLIPGPQGAVQLQQFARRLGTRRVIQATRPAAGKRSAGGSRARPACGAPPSSGRPRPGARRPRDHGRSCLFLASPGADHQRPQQRIVGEAFGVSVERGKGPGAPASSVTPCAIARQHATEAAHHCLPNHERLDPARDIGAIRGRRRRPRRTAGAAGTRPDVGAQRVEGAVDTRLTSSTLSNGSSASAHVVVLHDQVAPRPDGIPQPSQHGHSLGQVEQQQPREHQVERRAPNRPVRGEIGRGTDIGRDRLREPASTPSVASSRRRARDRPGRPGGPSAAWSRPARSRRPGSWPRARGRPGRVVARSPVPRRGPGPAAARISRRVPQRVCGLRPHGLRGGHDGVLCLLAVHLVVRTASISRTRAACRWPVVQGPSHSAQTCGTPPGAAHALRGKPG